MEEEVKSVLLRLPFPVYEEILGSAKANERSIPAEIRVILKRGLNKSV